MTDSQRVVVVGSGLGGLAAATTARATGADVVLLEKASQLGGAAAFSGGQVWVGANHVAERQGLQDDLDRVATYVHAIASEHPELLDDDVAEAWVRTAPEAARAYEDAGVVTWEIIPGYPDSPGCRWLRC